MLIVSSAQLALPVFNPRVGLDSCDQLRLYPFSVPRVKFFSLQLFVSLPLMRCSCSERCNSKYLRMPSRASLLHRSHARNLGDFQPGKTSPEVRLLRFIVRYLPKAAVFLDSTALQQLHGTIAIVTSLSTRARRGMAQIFASLLHRKFFYAEVFALLEFRLEESTSLINSSVTKSGGISTRCYDRSR